MSKPLVWIVILICFLPILLNLTGIDFGSSQAGRAGYWSNFEQSSELFKNHLLPLLLIGISIFIAFATLILSLVDFKINREIITPVAGTILFCAALADVIYIATQPFLVASQQENLSSSWLTSYGFSSTLFTMGIGVFVIRFNNIREIAKSIKKHILFTSIGILLITLFIVSSLNNGISVAMMYSGGIIARSYHFIPLFIYLIVGIFTFQKFNKERSSFFSQALLLSLIPALTAQLYIVLGRGGIDDTHFNTLCFMRYLTYFIPFTGLTLDYFQMHKNTVYAMDQLTKRAKELEQTEQQLLKKGSLYSALIRNIPDLTVLLFDKNLNITYADGDILSDWHRFYQIMIGKNICEITLDGKNIVHYRGALNGEEIAFERERNGKYYKEHILPVKDNEGNVYAGMSVLQDITEIKQYQKELELRIEELHRSNKELEQFAYVASHDLQEPLRKIRSFGDRLTGKYKQQLGEDGQNYIERMQSAAGRMQGLIDNLLDFSRLTKSIEPFAKTDLAVVVEEILTDLEISIEQKNARIVIEHLPIVEAMNGQMRQLFQNLISNALKFSKQQEAPLITIKSDIIKGKDIKELSKNYKDNKYCKIVVQDNGIGFEEKYLDRIFIIFQRLHGRSEYEGTGMGLAICKKIVENHNGIIKAESKVNKGATFIIILPIVQYSHEQLALPFKN